MQRRQFLTLATGSIAFLQLRAAPLPKVKSNVSLIYTESGIKKGEKEFCRIWSINVNEGRVGKPEEIITLDRKYFNQFHFGDNYLLVNRYLALSGGAVIDLSEKQLINVEYRLIYAGFENNSVIYRRDLDKKDGSLEVLAFHLKDRKTVEHENPGVWRFRGIASPDRKSIITSRESGITIRNQAGEIVFIGNDYSIPPDVVRKYRFVISTPAIWINDETIMTQVENGELVSINIDTKKRTPFAALVLNETEKKECLPCFHRDLNGRITYRVGESVYVIDLKTNKATVLTKVWDPLGEGFEYVPVIDVRNSNKLRHLEKDIGAVHGYLYSAVTCHRHIAFVNRGHEGIQFWSGISEQWSELKLQAHSVVGWIVN